MGYELACHVIPNLLVFHQILQLVDKNSSHQQEATMVFAKGYDSVP